MNTQTYGVKGMHCASCASIIEKTFKKVAGVRSVEVSYATEKAKVSFDQSLTDPESLSRSIKPFGYSLVIPTAPSNGELVEPTAAQMGMSEGEHAAHLGINQSKNEKLAEIAHMKRKVFSVMPLAIFSIVAMLWDVLAQLGVVAPVPLGVQEVFAYLLPLFAVYALFFVGRPYLAGFYRFLRYGAANMDTLIGIGTSVAFTYSVIVRVFERQLAPFLNVEHTYFDVTIVVIAFITLGKYLEARAKVKTGDAIEKLLNLQAKTAIVIRAGKQQEVPVREVAVGDSILIKPGGSIPVDGVVEEGSSFVDESMITGESMPIAKNSGDVVVAGTINTTGAFTFQAKKIGSQTLLAHIIKMVEEAQGSRAPIQALADKISGIFVPVVIGIAFVALVAWLGIGSATLGFSQALSYGLVSFVGILVIACPCALGLATPTAIIVGVGKGAREGILIKDAATLEKLYKVDAVVMDKTGTLTRGKPELVSLQNASSHADKKIIAILAALESRSEHPIARAVSQYAISKNISALSVSNFEIIKGKGVSGAVADVQYYAGNAKLISDLGLLFDMKKIEVDTRQGKTPIILATATEVLATAMVADAIKPEAIEAIKMLQKMGVKTVMLTGDQKNTAAAIAVQLGIDEVVAEVLPADKLDKIKQLQSEGRIVAMAGDGINDAPALAQADVGIAMGTGTDVAIETAGITLLHGDISKLVKAIRLSKFTMRGIKQNLFWAFAYNIIGIPLAAGLFYPIFGWLLNPIFAGLAMALSSVSVVSNSLRLKVKKL